MVYNVIVLNTYKLWNDHHKLIHTHPLTFFVVGSVMRTLKIYLLTLKYALFQATIDN